MLRKLGDILAMHLHPYGHIHTVCTEQWSALCDFYTVAVRCGSAAAPSQWCACAGLLSYCR